MTPNPVRPPTWPASARAEVQVPEGRPGDGAWPLAVSRKSVQPGNLLKIESLASGWCDKDHVMLHACFQLLKDCVEKENLLNGHINWEHDEKHREVKAELEHLYQWWLQRVEEDEIVDLSDNGQYEKDNEMLIRLIKVRWALWT